MLHLIQALSSNISWARVGVAILIFNVRCKVTCIAWSITEVGNSVGVRNWPMSNGLRSIRRIESCDIQ